jgi:hypothetical protein
MGTVTISGKTYSGNNISIINGVVTIDGKIVEDCDLPENVFKIKIEGSVENIFTDKSVECNMVSGNITAGGSVACDSIKGYVESVGSVNCEDIGGDANSGGSINCSTINGDAVAGGSINANRINGSESSRQAGAKTFYNRKPKAETILGKIAASFSGRIR